MERELTDRQWKQVSWVLDYIRSFPKHRKPLHEKQLSEACDLEQGSQGTPPQYIQQRMFEGGVQ